MLFTLQNLRLKNTPFCPSVNETLKWPTLLSVLMHNHPGGDGVALSELSGPWKGFMLSQTFPSLKKKIPGWKENPGIVEGTSTFENQHFKMPAQTKMGKKRNCLYQSRREPRRPRPCHCGHPRYKRGPRSWRLCDHNAGRGRWASLPPLSVAAGATARWLHTYRNGNGLDQHFVTFCHQEFWWQIMLTAKPV